MAVQLGACCCCSGKIGPKETNSKSHSIGLTISAALRFVATKPRRFSYCPAINHPASPGILVPPTMPIDATFRGTESSLLELSPESFAALGTVDIDEFSVLSVVVLPFVVRLPHRLVTIWSLATLPGHQD